MGCQGSKDTTANAVATPGPPSPDGTTLSAAELSYFSTTNILRSALVAAVRTRDAALVDAILTKKPAFRHNRIGDVSLVLSSCTDASVELLRVLLRHGASADDGLADGLSALHLAVMTNQVRVVELLVAHGADVNAATRIPQQPLDGLTPLHLAVRRGLVDVATALLESGRVDLSREDPDGFTAVQAAVARPAGLPVLRLLHSLGFVENLTSYSAGTRRDVPPLVLAIRPGNRETVEFLLKAGERDGIVNAAARDSAVTPLMVAAAEGLLDLVQILIAHGANVNAVRISEPIHSTALFEAAFEGHDEIVAVLLRASARHDVRTGDNGMTPLHAASSHGHVRCVELLCGAGADVDSQSRRDRTPRANSNMDDQLTPAHLAAFDGHHQVIDVLAANGANVDACSARGETPLMLAATHGQAALVAHLLYTHKVDVHRRDRSGSNALHKAVAMGHVDVARVLLGHGADANAVLSSPRRETPLHIVAATGSGDVAGVLLALGADPRLEDSEGNTPAQVAQAHGHHAIAALLNKTREDIVVIVPSPAKAG